MMAKFALFIPLWCALVAETVAFAPVKRGLAVAPSKTSLGAALSQVQPEQEDQALFLLRKARECAFSDSCSVEQARHYLNEVVHVQSGCVSGTLAGHELCDEQDTVADIVSHLRAKVDHQATGSNEQLMEARLWQIDSDTVVLYPEGLRTDNEGLAFASALFIVAGLVSFAASRANDAVPFTVQEWFWAFRDGYPHVMLSHLLRNGGL